MKYKNPALTVDGLIYSADSLLLIRRKNPPFKDCWALPGGFVDYGENVESACRREMLEETSLSVNEIYLFGVYSDPARDPRGHTVSAVYLIPFSDPAKARAASDASETGIFPFTKLSELELAFDHCKIIGDFLCFLKNPALFSKARLPSSACNVLLI